MRSTHTIGWGIGALVAMASAGVWAAADPADWVPLGASKPQAAYSFGPYTQEGMVLSERTLERYGWEVGPGFLQPYATAMGVHEDNIFLNSGDNKKSDDYLVFTPGATLLFGNPRLNYVYADYCADFTTLDAGDNDVFDGQTAKVGLRMQSTKSQADLSHEFQEVRDVDVQVGTRLKQRSNTTAGDFDTRISSKTSVGVLGRYSLHQFDSDAYSDYRDYEGGGRLSWQVFPKTSVFAALQHGWVDVDESRNAFGSAQYDEVSLGVSGHPRPRLETSGQVGVQHRYFEDDSLDDITREVGSVRVSGEPYELFRVWVQASAGLRPAINAPGYTVFDTRFEPGISRRLFSDRLVGSLSGVLGQVDYMGSGDVAGDDPRVFDGRKDKYWGFNANLDWWFGRYWSAGAGYSYINNDSDSDGRTVNGRATDDASYEDGRWTVRVTFNR